jgi:hypothetical protein
MSNFETAARQLASLYGKSFGGKSNGRFRLSSKQLREMLGRKRLYEDDIEQLTRAALEAGLVLINMDSFFVVLSANTFVNYRRVSGEALSVAMSEQ